MQKYKKKLTTNRLIYHPKTCHNYIFCKKISKIKLNLRSTYLKRSKTSEHLSRRAYKRHSRLFRPSERADHVFQCQAKPGQVTHNMLAQFYQPSETTQFIRYLAATSTQWYWHDKRTDLVSLIYRAEGNLDWFHAERPIRGFPVASRHRFQNSHICDTTGCNCTGALSAHTPVPTKW